MSFIPLIEVPIHNDISKRYTGIYYRSSERFAKPILIKKFFFFDNGLFIKSTFANHYSEGTEIQTIRGGTRRGLNGLCCLNEPTNQVPVFRVIRSS